MNFRTWLKTKPDFPFTVINRGNSTPASDEVIRTGLQPQVNSQEITTKEKDLSRKLANLKDILGKSERGSQLWNKFKEKSEKIKNQEDIKGYGLGYVQNGDSKNGQIAA